MSLQRPPYSVISLDCSFESIIILKRLFHFEPSHIDPFSNISGPSFHFCLKGTGYHAFADQNLLNLFYNWVYIE